MSNILAEVIHTRDAVTGDEFRDLLQNVGSKLGLIKTDLVESLQSTFVLHEADIDRVTSWYVEILGIQEKVDDLQKKFHEDRKALASATEDIDYLEEELDQCDKGITLLKSLIDVVRNIERADPTEFYRASVLVKTAQQEFDDILKSFGSSEDHGWVVGVRSNTADLITDTYEKASIELRSIFHFNFVENKLIINRRSDVNQLVKTLINIGYCSRVVNKLSVDIWQVLLSKACTQEYDIEITGKPKQIDCTRNGDLDMFPVRDRERGDSSDFPLYESSSAITIKAVKTSVPVTQVEVVFTNIKNILKIFNDIFMENPEVMSDFGDILGPKICDELGNKCLKNLILREAHGDITRAKENVEIMNGFIEELETELNFRFPEGSIFEDLQNDFDSLFLAQVKQDLLVKVRELIKGNLHATQEITYDNHSEDGPEEETSSRHRNSYTFPKCVVSKSVIAIVSVLKDHLHQYKDDITMCDAVFNMYLALVKVPKHESESDSLVPFSAVLVHNNSLFLAHHASLTFPMSEDKIPDLRSKATQAYSFMLRTVRTKLNAMISDAMTGILNNDDETSETEINNFLKISSEFVRLHSALQFVLPPATLDRTLATLVDHTVNEMCLKVLTWDDISAACGNKLASAFTQFAVETSELFKGDSTNTREMDALTANRVSKWNRFRLLTFILTASMKEIQDKWVGGCGPLAGEFKPDELKKLVRALFQNTDRRAAFLATIK